MADVEKRKIKLRRGLEADLPTLDEGEPALALDTNKFFIGGTSGNTQLANQKDLETISSGVDGVKADVGTAKSDIKGLKSDVSTNKGDISKLKSDVSTVKADLDTAEEGIGSLQTDMTAAKSDVSTLKTDITTAKSDISTLKSDVGAAKSDVTSLKSDMTAVKSEISSLQTDTGTLETDMGGIKNLISTSNGAVSVGDATMDITIKGKTQVSIAAPVLNVSSREAYHQGNFCNHAIFSSSDAATPVTLVKDIYSDLSGILDTIDSAFPKGKASAAAYTIPREGVYSFNITVKVSTAITAAAGYIRFGLKQGKGETVTDIDIQDVHYSNAFGTPILSATFIYKCAVGDVITPEIKPLTEDVTVGPGSGYSIYFLGDSIQA